MHTELEAERLPNSSRVLNLFELSGNRARHINGHSVDDDDQDTIDHHASGAFFQNPTLNKAVLIKHRLNADQRLQMINTECFMGTKVFVRYGFDPAFPM